jgi:excisionase family DNA binding protein
MNTENVGNVEPRLLRVGEVAARLDCNPETIRRKIARGELPGIRIGYGPRAPFRVDSSELETWLASRHAPNTEATR